MRLLLTIIILGNLATLKAQDSKIDTSNLYYEALKLHLASKVKFRNERPDLIKLPDTYYVEKDTYTTENLPEIINSQKIKYLTREDIFDKTKNRQTFELIAIRPAKWRKGDFEISVIDFRVSRKGKHLYYRNGGGSTFIVVPDENIKRLTLKVKSQHGI